MALKISDLKEGMFCRPINTPDESIRHNSIFKHLGRLTPEYVYVDWDGYSSQRFWVETAKYEFLVDGIWHLCELDYEINQEAKFPYWREISHD